jgi:hypothetical protein
MAGNEKSLNIAVEAFLIYYSGYRLIFIAVSVFSFMRLSIFFMFSSPAVLFLLCSKLPVWYELNIIVFRCVKKTLNSASLVSHNVQIQH